MGSIELVTRYIKEVWNQGDLEALRKFVVPGYEYYLGGQPPRNIEGMCEFVNMTREAFPDWNVEPVCIVGDTNAVAVRWKGEATHLGPFHGIQPTGRKIIVSGINFYEIEGQQIVKEWEEMDSLGMLRQMEVLPT